MISLHSDIEIETELTVATIVHFAIQDWLVRREFPLSHLPEAVELAVVMTGLGMPRCAVGLVKQTAKYWDSTLWDAFPRPFLDSSCLAYALSLAAWVRQDRNPSWSNQLVSDLKKPMIKSLKYLFKTDDCFFHPGRQTVAEPTQAFWLEMAAEKSVSSQIIAVRQMELDENLRSDQIQILFSKLRSTNRELVLHSISAIENMTLNDGEIIEELNLLLEDRDNEVQAKAMMALTKLGALSDLAIEFAVRMMDSSVRYVTYAAMVALASRSSIDEKAMLVVDRAFCRSLQSCDYDFVGLFAASYVKWLSNPRSHVESVLSENYSEYLDIAIESIENAQEQFVGLS